MKKFSDKQIKTFKGNLARNYRAYERAFEKAVNKNIYTGSKLTKEQFLNKYLQSKAHGLRYSVKQLVKPFMDDDSLKKVGEWNMPGYSFELFKKFFYSLSIAEQKNLLHEFFLTGLGNGDDFVYEGISFSNQNEEMDEVERLIEANRLRRQ